MKSVEPNKTQELLEALLALGLTHKEIAAGIQHRVGWRTIYRWRYAETQPQQKEHIKALQKLLESKQGEQDNAHN